MGHPLDYIATDTIFATAHAGKNVLYNGFDSFGLPAEQYAVKWTAPAHRRNTMSNMTRQLERIGLSMTSVACSQLRMRTT